MRLILPAGQIHIQRDDLLHHVVSGNKWRKMSGWLRRADSENTSTLLTYGGPIHTGKAFLALAHRLETGQLPPEGLVFLHTGGVLDLTPAEAVLDISARLPAAEPNANQSPATAAFRHRSFSPDFSSCPCSN